MIPPGMRPYGSSIQYQQQMQQQHQQQMQQQHQQQQMQQQQQHHQQHQQQQMQHQLPPQAQHQQQMHSLQNNDPSVYHRSQFPQFQQPTVFNTSPFNPYGFPSNNPNPNFQMMDPAILGTGNLYMNSPWGVPNQSNQTQTMNNPFQNPNTMYNMNTYSLYGNTFGNPPFSSHPTAQHSVINSESSSVRFSKSQS